MQKYIVVGHMDPFREVCFRPVHLVYGSGFTVFFNNPKRFKLSVIDQRICM